MSELLSGISILTIIGATVFIIRLEGKINLLQQKIDTMESIYKTALTLALSPIKDKLEEQDKRITEIETILISHCGQDEIKVVRGK